MGFSAQDVKKLRETTGAGMMACKQALTQVDGDFDKALEHLRQKGLATAAKKAGNIAAEGLLATAVAADKKSAVIVEVNSQTDFVAKNDEFVNFVKQVAQAALDNKTTDIAALRAIALNGQAIEDHCAALTAKIGEKIEVRRVHFVETDGILASYVHPVGSKVGAIVALDAKGNEAQAVDLAMHVAASNPAPEFVTLAEIPADEIAKEKAIEKGKDDLKGKPDEIIEKIVDGRVSKIFAAKVFVEQPFIKDPNQKVSEYLAAATVKSFVRFNLGEGVEKKVDNFAEEVAAMTAGA